MYGECIMKRTQIYITINQSERLKERAEKIGISVSELIRRILDEYLEEDSK